MTTDQPTLAVTQADREAAANLVVPHGRWPGFPADFRSGRADSNELTQAFAGHRITHSEPRPVAGLREATCGASPDHADIMETIENAADDWQKQGYTSALAEVRDMANVGRALMEALPKGYSYMNCPSEIVSDLQNERDEALSPSPASLEGGEDVDALAVEYAGEYVMSTEGADYEPTQWERALILDALHGFIADHRLAVRTSTQGV